MFCPFCGAQVSETTTFCPECGHNLANEKIGNNTQDASHNAVSASFASADVQSNATRTTDFVQPTPPQPTPTQSVSAQAPSTPQPRVTPPATGTSRQEKIRLAEQNGQGMKWYKFLVYFSLIAGGVIGILFGLMFLTGAVWLTMLGNSADAEYLYSLVPSLGIIGIICGIILLGTAALNITCWIFMRKFSKIGPILLYISYIASAILQAIAMLSPTAGKIQGVVAIAVSVGAFYLNMVYFRKRAYLFTEDCTKKEYSA